MVRNTVRVKVKDIVMGTTLNNVYGVVSFVTVLVFCTCSAFWVS